MDREDRGEQHGFGRGLSGWFDEFHITRALVLGDRLLSRDFQDFHAKIFRRKENFNDLAGQDLTRRLYGKAVQEDPLALAQALGGHAGFGQTHRF